MESPSRAAPTPRLGDLIAPVAAELRRVGDELVGALKPNRPDLQPLVEHAAGYRGKQLRPAMVLLAGKAVGDVDEAHFTIGKVVELLHTATLVHDDILDGAMLRRQDATLNAVHGNEVSVLLGDYIYAKAFHMAVQLDDPTCARELAEVVRIICQGEITQILHRFDFDWSEAQYFEVIAEKTASLYGASCQLGAHYAGGSAAQVEALRRFGIELGIAFQVVDDCLDLVGDEKVVGKSLGTDLDKGKLTLPLLHLLRQDEATARRLRALMESRDDDRLETLQHSFDLDAAVAASYATARQRLEEAVEALEVLPASASKTSLVGLADYVLARRL